MTEFLIDHNPRCSKSRTALEILRQHKIEPRIIDSLKTPPDAKTLTELLKKLGLRPRDFLRDNEDAFAQLHLADPAKTAPELIAAIVKHPILLQQPIITPPAAARSGPRRKSNSLSVAGHPDDPSARAVMWQ